MKPEITMHSNKAVVDPTNRTIYFAVKRVIDVVFSVIGLIVCAPLFALIYLAIRFESDGNPIYTQERVGVILKKSDNKEQWIQKRFAMYKFRTMRADASSKIHQDYIKAYIAGDEEKMAKLQPTPATRQKQYKLQADPRITRIGKLLRKTSLDELPQLINVLLGDMTLVGPRPPIPYEVALYAPHHLTRLHTKQGITGYWQVNGRNSTSFEEMVKLDSQYIQKQSLALDMKILVRTFTEMFYKQETA